MSKLTPKQEMFCREYVVDLNASQAAVRVGYSEKTANRQGHRLLTNADIQARVAELQAEAFERADIDAAYVLRQAKKLHERCMQEIEPVMVGSGKDRTQLVDEEGRPVFQFNAAGAAKGLEILGKHRDVQAFLEKHDHTSSDGSMTPTLIERVIVYPEGE